MKTNDELLTELLARLGRLTNIKPDEIPAIDLYMDQVTTFMEDRLKEMKRYPEDKILTKTMINNYAKNNLLPAPVKKKYSQEHILLLVFIYYFKSLLTFSDIETILSHITGHHFSGGERPALREIYEEVFSLEHEQMERLREDVSAKFEAAKGTFLDAPESERDPLQLFAFICELSFDVYLKKQMIEYLSDELRKENPPHKKK